MIEPWSAYVCRCGHMRSAHVHEHCVLCAARGHPGAPPGSYARALAAVAEHEFEPGDGEKVTQ